MPVDLLEDEALHQIERHRRNPLIQRFEGHGRFHCVAIELRKHQLTVSDKHWASCVATVGSLLRARLGLQLVRDVVHNNGGLRGNRRVCLGCWQSGAVSQGKDVVVLGVLTSLLVHIDVSGRVGQAGVGQEARRAHRRSDMQEIELLSEDLSIFALEHRELVAAIDLDEVGLLLGCDALADHQLLKLHRVVWAGEHARRRSAVLDIDLVADIVVPPGMLSEVHDFLRSPSAIHRRRRVGENRATLLRVLDVVPDNRGVGVGVDRGDTVLPDGFCQSSNLSEILLQTCRHDQDVVADFLPIAECDAVVFRIEGLASLLDPVYSIWNHLPHRSGRGLHAQAEASDHRPLRHVQVLVLGLDDGDIALGEAELSEELTGHGAAGSTSSDDGHLVLFFGGDRCQGRPEDTRDGSEHLGHGG
mmetsp:Transcript_89959/g.188083  ORF Transcript_89959/g.188083 Transcript_89959/m.188083 type:complete len:416 (-) Transcript_89959:171-1418(-)